MISYKNRVCPLEEMQLELLPVCFHQFESGCPLTRVNMVEPRALSTGFCEFTVSLNVAVPFDVVVVWEHGISGEEAGSHFGLSSSQFLSVAVAVREVLVRGRYNQVHMDGWDLVCREESVVPFSQTCLRRCQSRLPYA